MRRSLALIFLFASSEIALAADVRLSIERSNTGPMLADADGRLFLTGRALGVSDDAARFDVVLVLDRSKSTGGPSGADIDGDGTVGRERFSRAFPPLAWIFPLESDDPGDSILAAEVAAARSLLAQLEPSHCRVGVVAFAGDGVDPTPDASTIIPLTASYGWIEQELTGLLAAGPRGKTNFVAGLERGAEELMGAPRALSEPRPGARKIMLLLTDGRPTLPSRTSRHENEILTVAAAKAARAQGIRIDTFAIGDEAIAATGVPEAVALAGEGTFTTVGDPRDLVAAFDDVDLVDVRTVLVSNLTTQTSAQMPLVEADGRFSAFVPLHPGRNHIEVRAISVDGREARLGVIGVRGEASAQYDASLVARRNRLLESELDRERRVRLELARAHGESVRRELALEMAERRKKSLALRAERPNAEAAAAPAP